MSPQDASAAEKDSGRDNVGMVINEINITNFGKLQNRKYVFSPGLNVIYGVNEAGKTTLQQFIKAMLFGLEKKRGKSLQDEYHRYEPWDAPAFFAGSLVFETGGQNFLLERNFYHKEKRSRLVNMGDLEELSVDQGDLQMLLGNVNRSTYENTYCISQDKLLPGNDLGILLSDEKSNLTQTGDASFQLSKALEGLAEKRRSFEKQKKELEQVRQQKLERLQMKEQMLSEEAAHLQEKLQENKRAELKQEEDLSRADRLLWEKQKITGSGKETEKQEAGNCIKEEEKRQASRVKWSPCTIIGCAGIILSLCFKNIMSVPGIMYCVLQVVCAALVIFGVIQAMRKMKRTVSEDGLQEKNMPGNDSEAALLAQREEIQCLQDQRQRLFLELHRMQAADEVILQEIQEKEVQRANLLAQQEEAQLESPEETRAVRDRDAVIMAADTLQRLANELAEESDDSLNERMSAIVSQITNGKYDALSLDERQKLTVTDQIHRRKPEDYSQATMQQMYFAYRMASGELLAREEKLPLLLDEAFAGYDEVRLKAALQWLSEQDHQVFLFTCRHLEAEILQSEGIFYTEICI